MSQTKDNTFKSRGKILGIFLLFLTNICYISNNYVVKLSHVSAGEVALVRGPIQCVIFGILIFAKNRKLATDDAHDEKEGLNSPRQNCLCKFLLFVIYGFLISSAGFSCVTAILLMPIGDLVVLCFTTPVFSVFLEAIFLKHSLTIFTVILCFLIVGGDVLVVQPDFIFNSTTLSNETLTATVLPEHNGPSYFIGVGLSFYAAFVCALANIIQIMASRLSSTKDKNSNHHMMLITGLWSILLSFVLLPIVPNRLLTSPSSVSIVSGCILLLSSILTLMAFWFMVTAVSILQNPTLVTMIRTTEICISLVTEAIYWSKFPDPLSAVGSFIVMLCVILMSFNEKINSHINKLQKLTVKRYNSK